MKRQTLTAMLLALIFLPGISGAASKMAEELAQGAEKVEAPPNTKKMLLDDVKRYLDEREDKVEDIAETLDANNDREISGGWQSAARSTAEWAEDYFERIESKYENYPNAADFVGAARIREHNHFVVISKSELPEKRDLLWNRLGDLVDKQEELDKKWYELTRKDDAIDRDFQRVIKELDQAYTKVIEDEVRYRGRAKENLRTFTSRYPELVKWMLGKGADISAAIFFKDPAISELVSGTLEVWVDYNEAMAGAWSNIDSRMKMATRLTQTERNIFVIFAGTRKDVETFLKTYNESQVQRIESDAINIARKLESSEEDLADASTEHIQRMYKAYETMYEKFVDKHEHIFFGPLGQQGLEELLEVRQYEADIRVFRSHKMSELLNRKYLTGSTAFEVSLSELDDAHREHLVENILEPGVKRTIDQAVKLAKAHDLAVEDILERRQDTLRDIVD